MKHRGIVNRAWGSFVDDIIYDVEDSWISFFSIVPVCKRCNCNKKKCKSDEIYIKKTHWDLYFIVEKAKQIRPTSFSFPFSAQEK